MSETQAKAFGTVLETAGVACYVEQIVRNSNGYVLIVEGRVRLTQVEEAQRYVNAVGERQKADA